MQVSESLQKENKTTCGLHAFTFQAAGVLQASHHLLPSQSPDRMMMMMLAGWILWQVHCQQDLAQERALGQQRREHPWMCHDVCCVTLCWLWLLQLHPLGEHLQRARPAHVWLPVLCQVICWLLWQ
jgi:hypothetical protein